MKAFESDDLDQDNAPSELREAILDLMLAWPMLEYAFTIWIAFMQGVPVSKAAAELGFMGNAARLKKLENLYADNDDAEAVGLLQRVVQEHIEFSGVRNTVAHAMLIGTSKSKPDDAYFLTTRDFPNEQGFMEVRRLAFDSFTEARAFAMERSMNIRDLLKARGVEVD